MKKSLLSTVEPDYKETPRKMVKLKAENLSTAPVTNNRNETTAKKGLDIRGKVKKITNVAKNTFSTTLQRVKPEKKTKKRLTKEQIKALKAHRKNVILGIGSLLVVVSIAYSTTVSRTFVDSVESLVALAPQVAFAVVTLIKAFSKLYK